MLRPVIVAFNWGQVAQFRKCCKIILRLMNLPNLWSTLCKILHVTHKQTDKQRCHMCHYVLYNYNLPVCFCISAETYCLTLGHFIMQRNYMLQTAHCPPVSPVLLVSLFPSKLHPGGSTRWWRARARLSSRRSHSDRGIWHSSSSSAPSRPSARPAVLTCVKGDYKDESSFRGVELRLSILEALILRRSA